MKKLAILGATGSIGASTLSICRLQPELYDIVLLSAATSVDKMLLLCHEFTPQYVSMSCPVATKLLRKKLAISRIKTQVINDEASLLALLASKEIDSVMAAIVGGSGLRTALAAVEAGKEIFLANKEALVMSGQFFIDAIQNSGAKLWPVDSEHNAIFQAISPSLQNSIGYCDLAAEGVLKILLTGSGGPFLNLPISQFSLISPEQALKHPNWSMGKKISIDSATMMNKGLEFIEAKWLFNAQNDQIQVIIHPQSVIHSMVQYKDGSVIAQMGEPDMRVPISYVMGGKKRIESGVEPLNFFSCADFSFTQPDYNRYPCLKLAIEACYQGQQSTIILNAVNEVAVNAFLKQQIKFPQIAQLIEKVLSTSLTTLVESIDHLFSIDIEAKQKAQQIIKRDLVC
ncbi:MAG: 1-deoxy-D-xylulose-5-phosphate reductoisomerase [Psychromonas sp.]|nr:1-deoxy-D-xylulose-5-phosphate reductoisomerase [Psychromonas sp.]